MNRYFLNLSVLALLCSLFSVSAVNEVVTVRGASYSASGGFDAAHKAFGNDAAYIISAVGGRRGHRSPPRTVIRSPTPLPTLRPTLPPTTKAPSNPDLPSVSVRFQLEYGFSSARRLVEPRLVEPRDGENSRQPTQEEYDGLLLVTRQFYTALLRLAFANLLTLEAVQVGDDFRPNDSFPVLVEFKIVLVFATGAATPTDQEVSNTMQAADYNG